MDQQDLYIYIFHERFSEILIQNIREFHLVGTVCPTMVALGLFAVDQIHWRSWINLFYQFNVSLDWLLHTPIF